jgi:uncharacterized membrane protein
MFESLEIVLIAIIGLFILSIILIIIRDIIKAILDRFK